jgi:hypothetical protein
VQHTVQHTTSNKTELRYFYSTFMKNNYPKNFINKVLTNTRNQRQINKSGEQPEQPNTTITLPYLNSTSEMTARLLRPFNINVTNKPTHKLSSHFTQARTGLCAFVPWHLGPYLGIKMGPWCPKPDQQAIINQFTCNKEPTRIAPAVK